MDEIDNSFLETKIRMKEDKNFKNTILKNCSRLKQKDKSYNTIYPINKESPKKNRFIRLRYHRSAYNNDKDLKDNIPININYNNFNQYNNISENHRLKFKRKLILDYNFDKDEKDNDTDINGRNTENKIIDKTSNNLKIRVNINKITKNTSNNNINKDADLDNKVNENKDNNIFKKYYIKRFAINLNDNKNIKDKKKESNNLSCRSTKRILDSFYYNPIKSSRKDNKINEKSLFIKTKKKLKLKFESKNDISCNIIKKDENEKNEDYIPDKIYNKFRNIKDNYICSTEDDSLIKNEEKKEINKARHSSLYMVNQRAGLYKKENSLKKIKENNYLNKTNNINRKIKLYFKKTDLKSHNNTISQIKDKKSNILEKKRYFNRKLTPITNYKEPKKFYFRFYKEHKMDNENKKDEDLKNKNNIESYINSKKDMTYKDKVKENINIIFFDDLIELCKEIKIRNTFKILIKNINKKYIIDYDKNLLKTDIFDNNNSFNYCFKYFCVILISFYFLSKDEILYNSTIEKIQDLFKKFIYSSLRLIGYQELKSGKIKNFLEKYNFTKKVSIIKNTTFIIKLLFEEQTKYNSINNILNQLIDNIHFISVKRIIKIINQTILFYFNKLPENNKNNLNKFSIKYLYSNYITKKEKSPDAPYIKTNMLKKFCLVLDLDETIAHSIKLNFGIYYLLRPGTLDFIKEMSQYYEIVIFTSSPKSYADTILDYIDEKGDLISHRLYKSHVIFENGKSVKNLNLIGRDLNKIIFVDNMKSNAKYNNKNLYLIPSWIDDIFDDEIYKLQKKLKYIYESGKFNDDVTKGL